MVGFAHRINGRMFDTAESRPLKSHEAFYAHKQRIYVYAQPLCEILPDFNGLGGIAFFRLGTESSTGPKQAKF